MDSPKDDKSVPEARKVSRRSVMQAGLKAGPVIMSLPTVPAWAQTSSSVNSSNFCDFEQNKGAASCLPQGTTTDGTNELDDPFAPPGKNKDKEKKNQGQGAFLNSGTWLD